MMGQGECSNCGARNLVNDDHGLCVECIGAALAAAEAQERYLYADYYADYEAALRAVGAY